MGESQITNVYARALFEAAREAGSLEATGADLTSFVDAMRESKDLTAVLYNPKISSATKKKVVSDLTQGADSLFQNGVKLMIDKRHSDLIVDMQQQFGRLLKQENKMVEVEITSAIELPEATRASIRKRIEDSTGKTVEIKETVDAGILGGLILRFGDQIVDGSLKAKLEQLRIRLAQA